MSSRTFTERDRSHQAVLPVRLNLDIASNFSLPVDADPVDWTAAATKLTLRQFAVPGSGEYLDYRGDISISGGNVVLTGGLWRIRFTPTLEKTSGATDLAALAICNADGTTVHRQVINLGFAAANPYRKRHIVEHYLDVPAAGDTVSFRGAADSANVDVVGIRVLGMFERVAPLGKLDKE